MPHFNKFSKNDKAKSERTSSHSYSRVNKKTNSSYKRYKRHSGKFDIRIFIFALIYFLEKSQNLFKSIGGFFKGIGKAIKNIGKIDFKKFISDFPKYYYGFLNSLKKGFFITLKKFKGTLHFWIPAFLFCMIFAIAIVFSFYTVAVKVTQDNKVLGYFNDKGVYEETISSVENDISNTLGEEYSFESEPVFSFALVKRNDISNPEKVKTVLMKEAQDYLGQTYALYVDGKMLGTYPKEDGILDLLENIKKPYLTGEIDEKVEFIKKVEIIKGMYPTNVECSLDELRTKLLISEDAERYTVKKGDTAYSIAKSYNISVATLKSLNPDLNLNQLAKGDTLYVSGQGTYIGIRVSRTIKYNEEIPFSTEKINSATLFENTTQIKTKGSNGIKEFTADVVLVDGLETSRTIKDSKVTRNPVTQQVLVGSKKIAPSGSFVWPVKGAYVSSTFNDWRSDHYHHALDLAAPHGTPIYAADGGTVERATRDSGYGLNIVINHGNGVYSRYAHCSKLEVSVGQKVYQGQQIGRVGSTGYSTGPHCHFEIIKGGIDGTKVDPLKLLK